MERLRDILVRWLINRTADRIIHDGHTPEAIEVAEKQWRELAEALQVAAKIVAKTPQGQAIRQWVENPPQSVSLSFDDQRALQDVLDHPEDYTHLYPTGTALADIAFAETGIIETVARVTKSIEESPEALLPEVVEWLDKAFPASEYPRATYNETRRPHEE